MLDPNRPFAPARLPFYYGWVILGVATLGVLMSIPGQTMGVSVFTGPLLEATGLSRVQLANAYLVGTLASGLVLPRGGRLLDRFGTRLTIIAACLVMGCTLWMLSVLDRVVDAVAPGSATLMLAAFGLGFALLRFSGQGMLTMASRNLIPLWFVRRRGITSGVFSVFLALGFSMAPAILAACIDLAGGWRQAWRGIAMIAGAGMAVLAWLLARDNPEECGLLPDGDAERASGEESDSTADTEEDASREQAVRSAAFWAVTAPLALEGMVITGFTFHIVDLGAEAGLSREQAVGLFPPIAVVSVIVGFLAGAASDRYRLRPLVLCMLAGQAFGFASMSALSTAVGLTTTVLGVGIAAGMYGQLSTIAVAKLFGRAQLGAISSAQMSMLVIASALGPSLLAASRQYIGSYGPALLGCAAIPVLLVPFTLWSKDPTNAQDVW